MIKVNGYSCYNGGKSGSGTYQQLINLIPPINNLYSLFLGNCGVTRHLRPVKFALLNDIDSSVINEWQKAALPPNYMLTNYPANTVIEQFILAENKDTADTLVFLDPPYLKSTRKSQVDLYRYELSHMDHELLLATTLKIKHAKVILCSYANGMYDEMLKGWRTHDFMSKTRNGMAWERVYMNYEQTPLLHDYRYLGLNFREREAMKRIKDNLFKKLNRLSPQLRNAILADLQSQYYAMPAAEVKPFNLLSL